MTFKSLEPEKFGKLTALLFGEGAIAGVVAGYKSHAQESANVMNSEPSAQKLLGIIPSTVEQWLSEVDA